MIKLQSRWWAIPLIAFGIVSSGALEAVAAQQTSSDIQLRVARFWRGEGRTLLEGVVGLPIAAASRNIELSVRDSTGRVLHTESWSDSASATAATLVAMKAQTTTKLEFVLNPGLYSVAVRRAQAEQIDSATAQVRGFAEAPVVSDIVLSARMRVLADKEEPSSAEMKRGRYAIERSTRVTVLPTEPRLWYYLELYRQGADSIAQLDFRVYRPNSDSSLVRVTRQVAVSPRGTVDAAALIVQGLPPGQYRMVVTARAGNREDRREAAFVMGSFEQTGPSPAAPGATVPESALMDRYFTLAMRSDAEINDLTEALSVSAPGEAVPAATTAGLTTDAKRRYLARYWSRIPDPNPGTPQHEILEEYAQRVAHIQRTFAEQRGRSGVRTDRGRIYLRYGPPDARQEVQMSNRRSVDIWKYTRGRLLKFAFLDETGFQNFNMIYVVGDPTLQSLADWADRVGRNEQDAIRTILNF